MKVAVVILNYNGEKLLTQFLPGVIKYCPAYAEVIVADNASSDNSIQLLKESFLSVKIIELKSNSGFAGGYNNALQSVDADYYILLNSDIEVTTNWIEPVINFMDKHPNVAACQPKVRSFRDKHLFEHAGASGGFMDYLGYPFCRGRMFDNLEADKLQYDDSVEIFWATGACMFIRSKVFHDMEGFDDSFFAHMEEIDLCWRMKKQGHQLYCIPASIVYHVGGGTLPKANPKKTYLNFRNNLIMLYKNLDKKKLSSVLWMRFLLDNIAAFKFLFSSQWKDAEAVWKAYRYFLGNLSLLKQKRRNIKSSSSSLSCIYSKSIVKEYYLNGKKHFSSLNKKDFTV